MLKDIINKAKAAQKEFGKFTQEQVDKIFYEAAKAANMARMPLARQAVEETRMGVVEDKITKNHFASEIFYNEYRDTQTVGVFAKDESLGIEKIYEPVGIIAAVIPTTNPTSTAFFKTLLALKTRNGIIISAHPRAWECTTAAAKVIYDAAVKAGAPENIIQWLPKGSPMDATSTLMSEVDITLATGGGGLVKAAYSSGKPAIGVGAGNCPAIIHSSADIEKVAYAIIQSNTFDNGVVCATENSIVCVESVYEKLVGELEKQGAHIVTDAKEIPKVEKGMFKEGHFGLLNAEMVGQSPQRLGELFKINVPKHAKMLVIKAKGYEYEDALAHEKLSPMVSLYKVKDFKEALVVSNKLLELGPGHTSSLFIDEETYPELVDEYKTVTKSGRLVVNMPSSLGAIGGLYNFGLKPTLTIGCGSWGGNIFSENIGPQHLLNVKTLAFRRENTLWFKVPKKIYFKYGSTGEALKDLQEDGVKNIAVITDAFIWSLYGKKFTEIFKNLNVAYNVFTDVEPNPSFATVKNGTKMLQACKPDAIIALGGGSPLDAAKIMWLMYEYPDAKFEDLAMRFADIRRRIVKFPKLGSKAKLICIPTTAGTGSEVTPFAVITDEKTHIKYPLADYSLTPDTAICDAELMMDLPQGMTAATGMDAVTHNIEAIASLLATEFTDPIALQSLTLLFKSLQKAYLSADRKPENYGKDGRGIKNKKARQDVAHGATLAGVSFANAFLGIVHSLSHKIGGHLGVIHGCANSIYLPHVIYYNSEINVGEKGGYFSQVDRPKARQQYAMIADHLKLGGKSEAEKIDNLILALQKLAASVNVPASTKDYGIDSNDFYAILDRMSEEAYDDQCTGANPRIPLIKDLKQIYINAHEGHKIPSLANPNKKEYDIYHGIIDSIKK